MTRIALSKPICLLPIIYFRHGMAQQVGASVEQQQAWTTEPCAGETSWPPSSSAHRAADQLKWQTMNHHSASSVSHRKQKVLFF